MTPIQTWNDFNGFFTLNIQLFEDKIITKRKLDNENFFEEQYSFKDLLKIKHPIATVETCSFIYKKMTEQLKPKGLNPQTSKHWDFWKAIDISKITEIKFKINKEYSWKITKTGIAHISHNMHGKEYLSWQMLDLFFFNGLNFPDTKLKDRIKARSIIFNALDNSKLRKKISINDGFVLFDYDKIETLKFEKNRKKSGEYFFIEKGKVSSGGWSYPRDGGTSFYSIEDLWYNMKMKVPKTFRKHIPQIKANLENAIINHQYS